MRRGGSYEFFHIAFRDYMADTYGLDSPKPYLDLNRVTSNPTSRALKTNAQDQSVNRIPANAVLL
jgi:hypothetical protein